MARGDTRALWHAKAPRGTIVHKQATKIACAVVCPSQTARQLALATYISPGWCYLYKLWPRAI